MPATTWATDFQSTVLSGQSAKTVGRDFFDRDQCLFARGDTIVFGEGTETSTSFVTKSSVLLLLPPWIKSGHVLSVTVQLRGAVGDTGTARMYESVSATAGTEQSVTGSTYDRKTLTLTVPSDAWASSEKTIDFQLKSTSGGSVAIKATELALNYRLTDG